MKAARYSDTQKRTYWIGVGIALRHRNATKEFADGLDDALYSLLKDKLNIAKLTFTSGVNAASEEFVTKNNIERCPLCGIALNEKGVCPKCGYKK